MTFKVDDRVYETSTTTGSGDYTLDGAQVGFTAFSAMGANNLCPYFATDDTNWEVGIGTILIGPAKLQRTTVLRSSNADAAVNWGAGTRKIRCGLPAAMAMPRILSKSVAGGANVTLTTDEQRRQILAFSGALTSNIAVEVDATPWNWPIVHNNTSGAYTLTVKVTGQTGVTVGQGARVALACDGTDVRIADALAATQSDQETGTSTTRAVTPGRQQFHPSAAKAWAKAAYSGAAAISYNVSSITDHGTGYMSFNWGVDCSSVDHCDVATSQSDPGGTAATTMVAQIYNTGQAAGSTTVYNLRMSDYAPADGAYLMCAIFGDQA